MCSEERFGRIEQMRKMSYFRYALINLSVIMGIVGFVHHKTAWDYFTFVRDYVYKPVYTIEERKAETRSAFISGLKPYLDQFGVDENPAVVKLVAFKDAKVLHLFAGNSDDNLRYIKAYPIKAASGALGPKLMEGDRQVPEGVYGIEYLNPNSLFFLSMKLTYPNEFDKQMGLSDGREKLGFDIMIHGKAASIGCLAMGDQSIAELFHLATLTSFDRWSVIIAPTDLRNSPFPEEGLRKAAWVRDLYVNLKAVLMELPWPAQVSTSASNNSL